MPVQLPDQIFRNVLLNLCEDVIPHMYDPKVLLDFLRDSYEVGGAVSVLALEGVFVLIHKHNLDYPDFYQKLYSLLDQHIFMMKYRSRYFRLCETFLGSTHLPAYLVAAFIKRLMRLTLTSTPAGSLIAVRFVYNLLKLHPSCKKLIHNTADGDNDGVDPFVENEADPSKCNALESSLWEVGTVLQHYHPDVARLPKVLSTPALSKLQMDVRRASQTTYKSLFHAELKRWADKPDDDREAPALNFVAPTTLVECTGDFFAL